MKTIAIRVEDDLWAEVVEASTKADRSMSNFCRRAIEEKLEKGNAESAKTAVIHADN